MRTIKRTAQETLDVIKFAKENVRLDFTLSRGRHPKPGSPTYKERTEPVQEWYKELDRLPDILHRIVGQVDTSLSSIRAGTAAQQTPRLVVPPTPPTADIDELNPMASSMAYDAIRSITAQQSAQQQSRRAIRETMSRAREQQQQVQQETRINDNADDIQRFEREIAELRARSLPSTSATSAPARIKGAGEIFYNTALPSPPQSENFGGAFNPFSSQQNFPLMGAEELERLLQGGHQIRQDPNLKRINVGSPEWRQVLGSITSDVDENMLSSMQSQRERAERIRNAGFAVPALERGRDIVTDLQSRARTFGQRVKRGAVGLLTRLPFFESAEEYLSKQGEDIESRVARESAQQVVNNYNVTFNNVDLSTDEQISIVEKRIKNALRSL
jgi:hypothetical protein